MRADVHKPSSIVPADYEYVAEEYAKVESLGDALFLLEQRELIRLHRVRTGGKYAQVETTGNCQVCGSVNAIYTSLFYHAPSNTYVRMGHDCADKCEVGGHFERNAFRRKVEDAREYIAGKQKAQALLSDAGASGAWAIYAADYDALPRDPRTVVPAREEIREGSAIMQEAYAGYAGSLYYEEQTIRDIVGKLVKYGSISDNAMGLLKKLLFRIPDRDSRNAERIAQRAAERAAAKPAPRGRVKIEGTVLKVEDREDNYNYHATFRKVMTVKTDEGWLCWGSVPSGAWWSVERDSRIVFVATVEPSEKDEKFAFYKRPVLYVSPEEKKARKAQAKQAALAAGGAS